MTMMLSRRDFLSWLSTLTTTGASVWNIPSVCSFQDQDHKLSDQVSTQLLTGHFDFDGHIIGYWCGSPNRGLIIDELKAEWRQSVIVHGKGENRCYCPGPVHGVLKLNRIVASRPLLSALYRRGGDVYRAKDNWLWLELWENGKYQHLKISRCVLSEIGTQIFAKDIGVAENLSMVFQKMDRIDSNGKPVPVMEMPKND